MFQGILGVCAYKHGNNIFGGRYLACNLISMYSIAAHDFMERSRDSS